MKALIVVDLGYGDAGKGSVVDWATRRLSSPTVVRFNGGSQAGHNVVLADGRHHTFSQFGAGTFAGAATHLSRFMLVNPPHLHNEASALERAGVSSPLDLVTISPDAMVVTPWHKALNRARERRHRHGSCAHGVGETMRMHERHPELTLHAADVSLYRATALRDALIEELGAVEPYPKRSEAWDVFRSTEVLDDFLAAHESVVNGRLRDDADVLTGGDLVFEGAQGVLLDEWYGFHPYTTWSTCTFQNADHLIQQYAPDLDVTRLGLTRALPTRHGPGPFPSATPDLHAHAGEHNATNEWQGPWRTGWPDLVTLQYAVEVCGGIDAVGVTCMDHLTDTPTRFVGAYTTNEWTPHLFDYGDLRHPKLTGRIVPPDRGDLVRQESLTTALMNVRPSYYPLKAGELPDLFAEATGSNLGLLSFGPTAGDKRDGFGY